MATFSTLVQDKDAKVWYKGGFRAIALPKVYLVDKEARKRVGNYATPWDALGFFTSNKAMTKYQIARMQDDPAYKAAKDKIYAEAGDEQKVVDNEFADDYKNPNDPKINTGHVNNLYVDRSKSKSAKGDEGMYTKLTDQTRFNTPAQIVDQHGNIVGNEIINQAVDDTSLGGNDAINCYWAYNEDDDIVHPQTAWNRNVADNKGVNLEGMGRVYAENINKYQQILWMNFGLPVYKGSFTSLFGGSSAKARLINRGNTLSASIGSLVGTVFTVVFAFPLIPLYAILALSDLFNDYPVSKYFEHRTAMPMYYKFCNMLIGHLAVNLGLYRAAEEMIQNVTKVTEAGIESIKSFTLKSPAEMSGVTVDTKKIDNSAIPSPATLYQKTNAGTPEILKYGPDMLAIMYKRSLRLRAFNAMVRNELPDERFQTTDNMYQSWLSHSKADADEKYQNYQTQIQQASHEYDVAKQKGDAAAMKAQEAKIVELNKAAEKIANEQKSINSFFGRWTNANGWSNLYGMMMGSALQCIDYVGFRIEKSTSVSESVSNTTGPMEIASQVNGAAQQGYDRQNSLFGTVLSGRTGSSLWDGAAEMIGGFLNKVGDWFGAGNAINIISGNGFADIPERWQSSSFSRSYSVEFELRARYGDPVSWLQSVGIPLCCILAGCMPRGIGGAMYTSPFLIRCYCKGMFSIPTGIIESCSMTRGSSEFGWTVNRLPLSINVNMTLKDLSPILYIGMDNDMNASMDEYMSTLTGLGLYERTFLFPKFLRRINRAILLKRNTYANPLWWGNNIGNWGVTRGIATLFHLTDRPIKNG